MTGLQPTVGTSEMSQVQLEEQLLQCMRESAQMRKDLHDAAERAGRARTAYRRERAKKLLELRRTWPAGDGRMTSVLLEAKADADPDLDRHAAERDVSEALFTATRDSRTALGDEMSGWQSLLADIRPMVTR